MSLKGHIDVKYTMSSFSCSTENKTPGEPKAEAKEKQTPEQPNLHHSMKNESSEYYDFRISKSLSAIFFSKEGFFLHFVRFIFYRFLKLLT